MNADHDRISPTAKITAYWRSLTDIPFSGEIAEAVGAEETARALLGERIVRMGTLSPSIFEARFKSIDRACAKTGMKNVLELACGLSPRGLGIAAKGGIYVGTDLPDMHAESSPVILAIAEREGIPTAGLHLQPANVLNREDLEQAASCFRGGTFAVCNEGLLMYLDREERKTMAENIRGLLLKSGGCWITTDILFRVIRETIMTVFGPEARSVVRPAMKMLADQTGRNVSSNDFADRAEALRFYEDLGFSVEELPLYSDPRELSSASRVPEPYREAFFAILAKATVWILVPAR